MAVRQNRCFYGCQLENHSLYFPINRSVKPLTINRIIGVLCILTTVVIALLPGCLTNAAYFVLYALTGIGISLLLYRSANKSNISVRNFNIVIALTGGVALPFILFFTNPIGQFKPDSCASRIAVTVYVHGKGGRQDIILRQKGYVIMDVHGERKKAPIDENGEAHFQNLEPGDSARVNIDFSEPYRSLRPDSVYMLHAPGSIYLPVVLQGIGNVSGIVMYKEAPLEAVIVQIDSLSTSTDQNGHFSMAIPEGLQKSKYKVWFMKKGFKSKAAAAWPEAGEPMEIIMER